MWKGTFFFIVKLYFLKAYKYIMQVATTKTIKKHKPLKHKFRIVLFFLLVILILAFIYYIKIVCPVVARLSEEKVRAVATNSISEVVGDVLSKGNITYSDLVEIKYSSNNKVELIEIDSVKTNLLIREITKGVQSKFDNLGDEKIGVALGTFSGIPFLYGVGPNISLQLVPVGTVTTKFISNFKSSGINQTLHQLYFSINANIGLVMPTKTQNFNTQLEIIICESVIIGSIPSVYLQDRVFE